MTERAYRLIGRVWSIVGFPGGNMNWRERPLFSARRCWLRQPAHRRLAQTTFQNYRCADGSQFIVGFFQYDKRAHVQIDGKAVTLGKRLALSGSRYSGGGVTLTISKAGTTLKHARRPVTACEIDIEKGPKRFRFDPFSVPGIAPANAGASASCRRAGISAHAPAWRPGWRRRGTRRRQTATSLTRDEARSVAALVSS